MYSHEIDQILSENTYNIPSDLYNEICSNSPQICRVTYNTFTNQHKIQTKDGYEWVFTVYRKI